MKLAEELVRAGTHVLCIKVSPSAWGGQVLGSRVGGGIWCFFGEGFVGLFCYKCTCGVFSVLRQALSLGELVQTKLSLSGGSRTP